MSWSAWRRLVQPDMKKPIIRMKSERNFIRWRTVATPNDVRSPSAQMTCRPSRRLPSVARQEELSVNAQYSHEPTARMMMNAMPTATLESKGEKPMDRPKRLRAKSKAMVSSNAPTHSMQISIAPAHTRNQKPAYSNGSDVDFS